MEFVSELRRYHHVLVPSSQPKAELESCHPHQQMSCLQSRPEQQRQGALAEIRQVLEPWYRQMCRPPRRSDSRPLALEALSTDSPVKRQRNDQLTTLGGPPRQHSAEVVEAVMRLVHLVLYA